ncbi:MAG: VWA domain-containing protein [Chloroflexales bacterium]|nr:VWA domain-containing protein [Chloroflexales bacterium]
MDLLWPWSLLLLWLAPALVGLYLWMLRRGRRYAVRYSSLSLVREALSPYTQWRRHFPFALFLLAVIGLVLALARPTAVVAVPTNQTAIILAIDVSRSMCSTDIAPNRLVAAQAAARSFIERQPPGTRIGVVAFAGFAQLIQQPTTNRAALEAAVGNLTPSRGTAIGSGIIEALAAIAEVNPAIAPVGEGSAPAPPTGEYAPEIIVLLTDGVTTTGAPPLEAAQEAADRGVRVYTIGFGTENGSQSRLWCGGPQPGGFGGGPQPGGFGGRFRRGIDEATLEEIAELTGGGYYAASSAGELQEVFRSLPLTFVTRAEATEISAVFAAAGALLAALAISFSLLWNPLP